jgi:hypothetical protein
VNQVLSAFASFENGLPEQGEEILKHRSEADVLSEHVKQKNRQTFELLAEA